MNHISRRMEPPPGILTFPFPREDFRVDAVFRGEIRCPKSELDEGIGEFSTICQSRTGEVGGFDCGAVEEGVGDVVFFHYFLPGGEAEVVFRTGETEEVVGEFLVELVEEGDFVVFVRGEIQGFEGEGAEFSVEGFG